MSAPTLILNIDRDDDFGEKAGIKGPVIGYADCYDAALKLITADPEDSDANALFGAIKLYESLKAKNEDVEIALITGKSDVGSESDIEIGKQLDDVASLGGYKEAILVTDGAEDDYIIPLILSRFRIKYVKHIIVRHNQNIESLYYYIVNAIKDKKFMNKFAVPLGLVFLTYGVVSLGFIIYSIYYIKGYTVQPGSGAITFVAIVLGAYLVERGIELWHRMREAMASLRTYAHETRISFLSYVVAVSLLLAGIASSVVDVIKMPVTFLNQFLVFFSIYIWWIYGAIAAIELGQGVELVVSGKRGISGILYGLLFSLAIGMVVFGTINYIRYIFSYVTFSFAIINLALMGLGVVIAVLSSLINRYYNDILSVTSIDQPQQALFEEK